MISWYWKYKHWRETRLSEYGSNQACTICNIFFICFLPSFLVCKSLEWLWKNRLFLCLFLQIYVTTDCCIWLWMGKYQGKKCKPKCNQIYANFKQKWKGEKEMWLGRRENIYFIFNTWLLGLDNKWLLDLQRQMSRKNIYFWLISSQVDKWRNMLSFDLVLFSLIFSQYN